MASDFVPVDPCAWCGARHHSDDCRVWADCRECGRPMHAHPSAIRGGSPCLDCRDPAWRSRLPDTDPAYRATGRPVYLPYYEPESKTAAPPWNSR